jgi:predicted nucleic acid-binding Zn ribbon protein
MPGSQNPSEMKRGPVRIKDVVTGVVNRLGIAGAAELGRLGGSWTEVVGAPVAEHTEPTSLRGGVLRVRVDSPVWATEMGYLAEEIKGRANQVVGYDVVREVRVWTGSGGTWRPRAPGSKRMWSPRGPRDAGDEDPIAALQKARLAWQKKSRSER